MKRLIPVILTILLVLCAFPAAAFAAVAPITVSGTYDLSTMGFTVPDVLTIGEAGKTLDVTLIGSPSTTYGYLGIFCTDGNVNLTLQNVNISDGVMAFNTGSHTLTVSGTCNIKGVFGTPGISVVSGASLDIRGDGTLNVTGGSGAAGIGGGNLTISGGTINVTGGGGAAGIGNGMEGSTAEVHITGGNVTATGGTDSGDAMGGAGIGSGVGAASVSVEITGGNVKAYGGNRAAGIGGGQEASVGTITISGGTVEARGREGGTGIGGGFNSASAAVGITISGGTVYADGLELADDIGSSEGSNIAMTLSISGSAAVFAANDRLFSPVTTTTHTHTSYTTDTESSYGIAIPSAWVPTFGSYLRPCKLSYSAGSGGGTVPAEVTQLYQTKITTADGSGLLRPYYKFSGWNTKADGTGTAYAPGSSFTFSADITLYAQWTAQPELKSSVADGKIYTNGRIILTPNIPGGTWSFDKSMLSLDGNTFTGLKSGTTTVTYTVDGVSVSYTVVVKVSDLPATGQDSTLIWVFAAAAVLAAALAVKHNRRATS